MIYTVVKPESGDAWRNSASRADGSARQILVIDYIERPVAASTKRSEAWLPSCFY